MGVHGLWDIINAVGHPIKLDGLEGKRLGVDASIWLYKFIRGFREKDNATNIDSYKVALFNRICKLLFYKIKPVFVFDGPAPVLKRRTLEKRQLLRNKNVAKAQETAMKLLAQQIQAQYPDLNVKNLTLPHLTSHNLVAAEKFGDDDKDLFYLPPIEAKVKEESDDDEEEFDVDSNTMFLLNKQKDVDIHSKQFDALPPEVRYELLQDIKESRRRIVHHRLPEDANSFANLQMQRLRDRRIVQEKIEQCEKEICTMYTGETVRSYRVQSDSTSTMLYIKNQPNSMPATIGPDSLYRPEIEVKQSKIESNSDHGRESAKTSEPNRDVESTQKDLNSSTVEYRIPVATSGSEVTSQPTPQRIESSSDSEPEIASETRSKTSTESEPGIEHQPQLKPRLQSKPGSPSESKNNTNNKTIEIRSDTESEPEILEKTGESENPGSVCGSSVELLPERTHELVPDSDSESDLEPVPELELNSEPKSSPVPTLVLGSGSESESESEPGTSKETNPNLASAPVLQLDSSSESEPEAVIAPEPTETGAEAETATKTTAPPFLMDSWVESEPEMEAAQGSQQPSRAPEALAREPIIIQDFEIQKETSRKNAVVTDKVMEDAKELLRLFGVPYIVAAGEAEAQCALLEELQLTDGTVTDDSDVWLFGAKTVYRHFFSDDKYVLQYKMKDIEFHVHMSRENLICFAMLVGSDYTEGVRNVGPVAAIEILSEFKGKDLEPLIRYKDYKEEYRSRLKEIPSKKRRMLLKYDLPEGFPSPVVFDGYMKPCADNSTDQFTWGTPDLDELREYARRNFAWDNKKIDEKLLPVMKKVNERKSQTTIDSFFFKSAVNRNPELFRSKRVNEALDKIAKRSARAAEDQVGVVQLSEDDDSEPEASSSRQQPAADVSKAKGKKLTKSRSSKGKRKPAKRAAKSTETTILIESSEDQDGAEDSDSGQEPPKRRRGAKIKRNK